MTRYGCFEIRTSCRSCGHPIPVNGPQGSLTCTTCFEEMVLSPERIAGFLNDFEEDYEGLTEGQGQGGTLMSGDGTFKYGYWRLEPRCSSCRSALPIPEEPGVSTVRCSNCDLEYFVYPVSEQLQKKVPSARLCFALQPPPGNRASGDLSVDDASLKPVVMSCPQCAAALAVSSVSERIMKCSYCNSEVYVPDAIWKRLHPVVKSEEWFVSFEGQTGAQIQASRRLKDQKDQRKELKARRVSSSTGTFLARFRPLLKYLGVVVVSLVIVMILFLAGGHSFKKVLRTVSELGGVILWISVVIIPVGFAIRSAFFAGFGKGKGCKQAMKNLAEKHNWKHESAEYNSSVGYINASYLGRDIEIDPGDDYAIEVEIHDSPFYLNTEAPGYPGDEVQRFTTGDRTFDDLFPIRYATAVLTERIERSLDEAKAVLAPVYWFLDRWEGRLGRLKIDSNDVSAHLVPGHVEIMDSGGKYLPGEYIEPLLEDMIVLAAAIDAVSAGKEPEFPANSK